MLQTAIRAAREAGRLLLDGARGEIEVLKTERRDVKLAMDRRAESAIIAAIQKKFPDHAILSEEVGRVGGESEYLWVIDPLDGTLNYSRRIPFWCTSIGLAKREREILGVIYDPFRDELLSAEEGKGAQLNGRKCVVSDVDDFSRAVLGFAYSSSEAYLTRTREASSRVAISTGKIRSLGAAALMLAYVACGRFDVYFQYGLHWWDIAAAASLIREAGGQVTIRRNPDGYLDVAASNGLLHQTLLREIEW